MSWTIRRIWREHTYKKGRRKSQTHQAIPYWSEERNGYDTYPAGSESSNELPDAEVVESLEILYEHLSRGRGVRCVIPTTGDKPILVGSFQAFFAQD